MVAPVNGLAKRGTAAAVSEAATFAAAVAEWQTAVQQSQFLTCQLLYLAKQKEAKPWFSPAYGTFKAFCEDVCGFSEQRGHQLAGAYEVCKNLADYAKVDDVNAFFRQWLTGFTERHARALKPLEPEQQVAAWKAARKLQAQPTCSVLEDVAREMKATPQGIAALPGREQRQALVAIEKAARAGYDRKQDVALAKLATKRLRKILAEAKTRPEFARVVELGEEMAAECARIAGS